MKRSVQILILLIMFPIFGWAQDRTKTINTYVTGSSAALTNDLRITTSELAKRPALELKRIEFKLIDATLTNVFQIGLSRTYEKPTVWSTQIITNTQSGTTHIYTNTVPYSGGPVSFTNTQTVATTTNTVAVQVYDADDFGEGLTIEPNDVVTYSFTETNAFNLIQVYTLRERP